MKRIASKRVASTAVVIVAGLVIAWAVARAIIARPEFPDVKESATLARLGPYLADMTLRQAFDSLPRAGGEHTGLTLLPDNIDAWAARWRMLADARHSVDVSYFILREDVFGAAFLGHLLYKARQGVHVRVLLDSQGTVMAFTSPTGSDWLDTLANTQNIEIKLFRPIGSRYFEAVAKANPIAAVASEHDKILVCDRMLSLIGGRNISTEYFSHPADLPKAFQDVDLMLQGRAVARGLTAAFEMQFTGDGAHKLEPETVDLASYTEDLLLAYRAMDAWLKGIELDTRVRHRIESLKLSWIDELAKLPRSRGTLARRTASEAEAETRLLDSRTRMTPKTDIIAESLRRLIQSARERILIQSPYLVLSEEAVNVLENAGKRGVAITIYTNSPISSDNALSQAFFQEQWPSLLARVPGLRLFVSGEQRTLHSKLMVFDDRVALVGTYNLDPVSMGINSEIMAAVWSGRFAKRVAEKPRADIAHGAPLVYEYKIARDRDGRALRDDDGRVVVAFGPKDHAPPDEWRKVQTYWAALRAAEKLPGFSPLF